MPSPSLIIPLGKKICKDKHTCPSVRLHHQPPPSIAPSLNTSPHTWVLTHSRNLCPKALSLVGLFPMVHPTQRKSQTTVRLKIQGFSATGAPVPPNSNGEGRGQGKARSVPLRPTKEWVWHGLSTDHASEHGGGGATSGWGRRAQRSGAGPRRSRAQGGACRGHASSAALQPGSRVLGEVFVFLFLLLDLTAGQARWQRRCCRVRDGCIVGSRTRVSELFWVKTAEPGQIPVILSSSGCLGSPPALASAPSPAEPAPTSTWR